MKNPYIKKLIDISIYDLREVGVKNASLGELIREIDPEELAIPRGYAITATAHQSFMEQGGVKEKITTLLKQFNLLDAQQRNTIGISIRESIMKTPLPRNLKKQNLVAFFLCVFKSMVVERSKNILKICPNLLHFYVNRTFWRC